jgi:hypothetical protein
MANELTIVDLDPLPPMSGRSAVVARLFWEQDVAGSTPAARTNLTRQQRTTRWR